MTARTKKPHDAELASRVILRARRVAMIDESVQKAWKTHSIALRLLDQDAKAGVGNGELEQDWAVIIGRIRDDFNKLWNEVHHAR